jgi:16S rRNA (guanine966-N2)-methyltransferase
MRIVAGKHRGRRLAAGADAAIRPTADRARQGLFNVLAHGLGDAVVAIEGAVVLDVFAGSGALGLEALSRGAAHAIFVENERAAVELIRANVRSLNEEGRATILTRDALNLGPPPAAGPAAIAFFDPPYRKGLGPPALAAAAAGGWLADRAIVVLECATDEKVAVPAAFTPIKERRYGAARIAIFAYRAAAFFAMRG